MSQNRFRFRKYIDHAVVLKRYHFLILIAKKLQVEGSLTFTDNAGEGFKVFGRGTEWETIKGGKTATQAAEEAEIFKLLLLQHAAAVPEGLEADLYAREIARYFPNDPPPKDGDPNAPLADPNAPRTSVIGEVLQQSISRTSNLNA